MTKIYIIDPKTDVETSFGLNNKPMKIGNTKNSDIFIDGLKTPIEIGKTKYNMFYTKILESKKPGMTDYLPSQGFIAISIDNKLFQKGSFFYDIRFNKEAVLTLIKKIKKISLDDKVENELVVVKIE